MTRRDWWCGVGLVIAALIAHAMFPRYEWRDARGMPMIRIDRWTGRQVRGHYDCCQWIQDVPSPASGRNPVDELRDLVNQK